MWWYAGDLGVVRKSAVDIPLCQAPSTLVSCPGRVCLAGENLDWTTGPVVTCALDDLRVFVSARFNPLISSLRIDHPFNIQREFDLLEDLDQLASPLDIVREVLRFFRDEKGCSRNLDLAIMSTLPSSAGLSSSAAVSLALAQALSSLYALDLDIHKICEIAFHVEAEMVCTGCGQMDQYACGLGGLLFIDCSARPPATIERLETSADAVLVIGDTGIRRNTAAIIADLKYRRALSDPLFDQYLTYTGSAINEIRSILSAPHWSEVSLGREINYCHALLRNYAQVSTVALEELVRIALQHGAYGAKLTGAGRGGCMFALTDLKHVDYVATAIRQAGAVAYVSGLGRQGLRFETVHY